MKKFSLFETTVIGFLFGVVVSTSLVFLVGAEHFVGNILRWASLIPLGNIAGIPVEATLSNQFFFVLGVFTLYGLLFGALLRFGVRARLLGAVFVLFVVGVTSEQYVGLVNSPQNHEVFMQKEASVFKTINKAQGKYFGMEARGDLDGDNDEDVVFIVPREDEVYGKIYYLTTALKNNDGHEGTNLVFLGYGVNPKSIIINNRVVDVGYLMGSDQENETGSQLRDLYFRVSNGVLVESDVVPDR